MEITIKLFAHFRDGRFKEAASRSVASGTTPADIVSSLGIDLDEVGVIMVNNRQTAMDYHLQQDDVLSIFPRIGGG